MNTTDEIIHWHVLRDLAALAFPIPEREMKVYPDGSAWMSSHNFRDRLTMYMRANVRHGVAQTRFRPLGPFGSRLTTLTYPGSYAAYLSRYEEFPLIVMPAFVVEPSTREAELSHLTVRVESHVACSAQFATGLASTLQVWLATIGQHGVFDEGGVRSIGSPLRLLRNNATFAIDASASGQHTLNSLILAIITWGISAKKPLYQIELGADRAGAVFPNESCIPIE